LERDGLIERQHGRGTFVLEPPVSAKTLAFISSPSITHDLMVGISQTAFKRGYQLQILGIDPSFRQLETYLKTCLDNGVSGFLFYPRAGYEDKAAFEWLLKQNIPAVMVDRYYPQLKCDYVAYDNEGASFTLTETLIRRGHQRVAIIPGFELLTTAVRDRLEGYRKALEHYHIPHDEDLIWLELYNTAQPAGAHSESYQNRLRERLETQQPTALITINNDLADFVIHDLLVLQRSLLKSALKGLPTDANFGLDIELATFSDRLRADQTYLNVVAVHPTLELGRTAAKVLLDKLEGTRTKTAQQVVQMNIVELQTIRQLEREVHRG
jgi:DNA-binding LacI/PurR family transcriptional regulator